MFGFFFFFAQLKSRVQPINSKTDFFPPYSEKNTQHLGVS